MPSSLHGLLNCAPFVKKGLKIGTLKAHCHGTTFCPITHIISIEMFLIYVDFTDDFVRYGKTIKINSLITF